jgi:hypothetical protein
MADQENFLLVYHRQKVDKPNHIKSSSKSKVRKAGETKKAMFNKASFVKF